MTIYEDHIEYLKSKIAHARQNQDNQTNALDYLRWRESEAVWQSLLGRELAYIKKYG